MDREKLVRDLVSTFEDRSELHAAYKGKMKEILHDAIIEFLHFFKETGEDDITVMTLTYWVNEYVETRFRPEE